MTLRGKRTLGRVEQQDLTIICDEQAEVYSFVGSMIADLGIEGAQKNKLNAGFSCCLTLAFPWFTSFLGFRRISIVYDDRGVETTRSYPIL